MILTKLLAYQVYYERIFNTTEITKILNTLQTLIVDLDNDIMTTTDKGLEQLLDNYIAWMVKRK